MSKAEVAADIQAILRGASVDKPHIDEPSSFYSNNGLEDLDAKSEALSNRQRLNETNVPPSTNMIHNKRHPDETFGREPSTDEHILSQAMLNQQH